MTEFHTQQGVISPVTKTFGVPSNSPKKIIPEGPRLYIKDRTVNEKKEYFGKGSRGPLLSPEYRKNC
jgi:hypothetical protein